MWIYTRERFRKARKMAKKQVAQETLRYLLGVCVPTTKQNAAKIRIRKLELDTHILYYFAENEFIYAADPKKYCKTGDVVLIQSLPEKLTRLITHKVIEVVYPLGDITDPITGKKVVAKRYREDMESDARLYGKLDSAFDYDNRPERGTLEGIRDFSNKQITIKHNDEEDPYKVNPF